MLGVAVIGLGVGESHISAFEKDPRCRVLSLCDSDSVRLVEVGQRHPGKKLVDDFAEIIADENINALSIASYDDTHFAQVMEALASGRHVFVEKPLCRSEEELSAIETALALRPDLQLSSNLILRRSPRFMALRERIASGEMGRIYCYEGDYLYGRVHKLIEGWRGRIPDFSVTLSGGLHMIDLIRWLSGAEVVEVVAMGCGLATAGTSFSGDDLRMSLLRLSDGALAKISANFSCVMPHFHALSIYGTKMTFQQTACGALSYSSRDPAEAPMVENSPYPAVDKGDLIPGFVAAILDGKKLEIPATEVFASMRAALAVDHSIRTGQAVRLEGTR
jgi:predicted dehydrogenase